MQKKTGLFVLVALIACQAAFAQVSSLDQLTIGQATGLSGGISNSTFCADLTFGSRRNGNPVTTIQLVTDNQQKLVGIVLTCVTGEKLAAYAGGRSAQLGRDTATTVQSPEGFNSVEVSSGVSVAEPQSGGEIIAGLSIGWDAACSGSPSKIVTGGNTQTGYYGNKISPSRQCTLGKKIVGFQYGVGKCGSPYFEAFAPLSYTY